MRPKYPIFGKDKIKIMLEAKFNIFVSVSAVRRILKKFIDQRKIVSVANFCGKKIPQ